MAGACVCALELAYRPEVLIKLRMNLYLQARMGKCAQVLGAKCGSSLSILRRANTPTPLPFQRRPTLSQTSARS